MNFTILEIISVLLVFSLALLLAILFVKYKNEKKTTINLSKEKEFFQEKYYQIEEQKQIILEQQNMLIFQEFKKGVLVGETSNKITVKVDLIENEKGIDFWIYNNKEYFFGYKYTLCVNGIPTVFSSTHILKHIKKSQLDKEKIKQLLSGIQEISSLANGSFIIGNSIHQLKENLVKQLQS